MSNPTIIVENAFATSQFAAKLAETGTSGAVMPKTGGSDLVNIVLFIVVALAILGAIGYVFIRHQENIELEKSGVA